MSELRSFKNIDRLVSILYSLSKGKVDKKKARHIVEQLDLTEYYKIVVLDTEEEAREFLSLTEQTRSEKNRGKVMYYTESGNVIEGVVKFGKQTQIMQDKVITCSNRSVKELPSGVLDSFVVVKTRQTFNLRHYDNPFGETQLDHILGVYVKGD